MCAMRNEGARVIREQVGGETFGGQVHALLCNYAGVWGKHQNNSGNQAHYTPHAAFDMELRDSANMYNSFAFELTHAAPHSVCWKELAS